MPILAALFLLVALSACSSVPQAELEAYVDALKLSVRPVNNPVDAESVLALEFTLTNTGREVLRPCRNEKAWVHLFSDTHKYVRAIQVGSLVDHPGCEIPLSLAPATSVVWVESIELRDLPPGPNKLVTSVVLAHPKECSEYGCYTTSVAATAADPLQITARAN